MILPTNNRTITRQITNIHQACKDYTIMGGGGYLSDSLSYSVQSTLYSIVLAHFVPSKKRADAEKRCCKRRMEDLIADWLRAVTHR